MNYYWGDWARMPEPEREKQDLDNPSLQMIYQKLTELEIHVTQNHIDIEWLKKIYESLSNRQWIIVTGIIITILIQLVLLSKGI